MRYDKVGGDKSGQTDTAIFGNGLKHQTMIPNFALDLSEDGIVFLHRDGADGVWHAVSEVELDAPDLADRLKELRQIAIDLAGEDFRTEVILPPSQLLYATLKVDHDAGAEVPRALEELTPYTIDQLRYDIDDTGDDLRVVAVARETLDEAEEFVGPYGLNMIRFTARPEAENFSRDPDLGRTRFAEELAPVSDDQISATEDLPVQVEDTVQAEVAFATASEPNELEFSNTTKGFSTQRRYSAGDPPEEVGKAISRVQPRIAVPSAPENRGRVRPAAIPPSPAMRASSAPSVKPKIPTPTILPASSKAELSEPIQGLANDRTGPSPVVLRLIAALFIFLLAGLVTAYSSGWLDAFLVSRQESSVSLEEALASTPEAPEIAPVEPLVLNTSPNVENEAIADQEVAIPEQPAIPEPLTESAAETAYVLTGIWQKAPELGIAVRPGTLDDLYVASLDPGLAFEDAPALQAFPSEQGGIIEALLPPPPADTVFELDSNGLVKPSRDGALNADGVPIFEGSPPVAAQPRPGGTAEQAAPLVDSRLAAIRPQQRPGGLSDARERASFGGLTRTELAGKRPVLRPESAQSRADAIARALAEASATGTGEEGTQFAVAASLAPKARPNNIDQLVARAIRTEPNTGNPAAAASTAAVAATGPAVARNSRATPSGPTRASVARAATDNNAISLGRVALVGVFGPSSNRRALVRMPNGRFKKVSVGDRIDGGRVAAIGEGALRYVKGSRTVTLEMPRS